MLDVGWGRIASAICVSVGWIAIGQAVVGDGILVVVDLSIALVPVGMPSSLSVWVWVE